MRGRPITAEYALYRGDKLLDIGTAAELAERRGISKTTVYYFARGAHHRRAGRNAIKGYRIDESED
jgi:hypothetical protein